MKDVTIENLTAAPAGPRSEKRNPKSAIRNRLAFTLVELMIVIGLIVLIAAIALPSIIGLFSAGADSQAHNIMAAQLAYARAIAIQNNTYAGVHVQMADALDGSGPDLLNPDLEDTCFSAIVWDDPETTSHELVLLDGSKPREMPGSIAFGQLKSSFLDSGGDDYESISDSDLEHFTTFTIVFSPSGQVVTNVAGASISLNNSSTGILFDNSTPALWNLNTANDAASNTGATAITMFDYIELKMRTPSDRASYLNESGQFLPVNVYTGQLFPRK